MEINTEEYSVCYNSSTETITCKGSLRLSGMEEYEPIVQLLNELAEKAPDKITLSLQNLEFLNSSGINVLSKYVIKVRQKGNIKMVVQGSKNIPWQGKSLKNLQRLMPSLQLELD